MRKAKCIENVTLVVVVAMIHAHVQCTCPMSLRQGGVSLSNIISKKKYCLYKNTSIDDSAIKTWVCHSCRKMGHDKKNCPKLKHANNSNYSVLI